MRQAFERLAESQDEDPVLHIEAREIRARRRERLPDRIDLAAQLLASQTNDLDLEHGCNVGH